MQPTDVRLKSAEVDRVTRINVLLLFVVVLQPFACCSCSFTCFCITFSLFYGHFASSSGAFLCLRCFFSSFFIEFASIFSSFVSLGSRLHAAVVLLRVVAAVYLDFNRFLHQHLVGFNLFTVIWHQVGVSSCVLEAVVLRAAGCQTNARQNKLF